MVVFSVVRLLRKFRKVVRSVIFYSLILFFMVLFIGALVIYVIEYGKNPGIKNYFDAVWFVMETITTVGYGDIVPVTFWGRIADMVIMPVGIAIISVLTASIATELTENAIMKSLGHHTSSKGGHVVIMGSASRALKVINMLINIMNREGKYLDVLYLFNGDKPPSLPSEVEFVRGDPFNVTDLMRAGVDKASVVIIVPFDEVDANTSDAKVTLLIMSIRKINANAYIIAEVLNEVNTEYVIRAGANSAISLGSYTTSVIANEVFNHGLSSILSGLVSRGIGVVSSDGFVGAKFIDVARELKVRNNYVLIGVLRNGETILNPSGDFVIQSGDLLIVIK
ncbi:MAG: potassium channel family protein [Vulcanisaeta sp.]